MRVGVGCEFVQVAVVPTHAVLQVEPRLDAGTLVTDEVWSATMVTSTYLDGFGNRCRRLTLPVGTSTLVYRGVAVVSGCLDAEDTVAAEITPGDLPDDTLVYTLPSRFCPSDELADAAWELFSGVPPGWGRVQAICDWVHAEISFGYGTSSPTKTAADVYGDRRGVCRDFAHLAVTFCRALNIPARYVFGYLPDVGVAASADPMDFAAWTEVFLGGSWWTFDPRNNERRAGRVLIGRGRDATDVAMVTTFGAPELQSMTVWADEIPG